MPMKKTQKQTDTMPAGKTQKPLHILQRKKRANAENITLTMKIRKLLNTTPMKMSRRPADIMPMRKTAKTCTMRRRMTKMMRKKGYSRCGVPGLLHVSPESQDRKRIM